MISKILLPFILLLSNTAGAQITLPPENTESYKSYDMLLDLPAVNEWIDSTRTQSVEKSIENWSLLLLTLHSNFKNMRVCQSQFFLRDNRFLNLSLPLETQRVLLHFLRQKVDQLNQNFKVWVPYRSEEKKNAAIFFTLHCLENRYRIANLSEADAKKYPSLKDQIKLNGLPDVEKCIPTFQKSSSASQEQAYKAVDALINIEKTLLILSCTQNQEPLLVQDQKMIEDYATVMSFSKATLVGHSTHTLYTLKNWLTNWSDGRP